MFKGSNVALITPFKDDKLDVEAYIKLIHFQIRNGTNGLVPAGTTGESPTLSHDEHQKVIELCIKESNTIIPAHYHGSIVAITIAIMGFIFLLFSQYGLIDKSYKLIKIIPLTYFSGQLLHIGGLALSGGYGALRKSPDSLNNIQAKFWMGIMGMGGLIAIIAGFLFIYVCYIAYRKYRVI